MTFVETCARRVVKAMATEPDRGWSSDDLVAYFDKLHVALHGRRLPVRGRVQVGLAFAERAEWVERVTFTTSRRAFYSLTNVGRMAAAYEEVADDD